MKFKQFVAIAAFAALGSVSNFAAAQTIYGSFTEAGAPNMTSAFDGQQFGSGGSNGQVTPGTFDYTYIFNLSSATTFTTLVTGNWGITGLTGTISGANSGSLNLVAGGSFPHLTLGYGALSGDSAYTLHFTGAAADGNGGFQVALTSVAAVPEPETYAMLLAGLGVIGAVARRRSRISVA